MRWSWKIARIAGIDIYMHATFVLLIGWVALMNYRAHEGLDSVVRGVGFILALFACVVLHELGHALTARRYGIPTRDITLLPIGGVARLERMPDRPVEELWVALAGPAVNVVIAAVLYVLLTATNTFVPVRQFGVGTGPFLGELLVANVLLVGFNLIPAFPMDGGRVLRSLLAMKLEYTRATHVAASLGQALAFVFGFVGLMGNPFLLFIALFVWIGAAQESSMAEMRSVLRGVPVRRAMITDFATVRAEGPVSEAVELVLAGTQKDFPVVENGRLAGVLTQSDLFATLARQGDHVPIGEVMRREFQTADAHEMLERAFARIQQCECHTLPVTRDGALVGLLTMENIGEFIRIQSALDQHRAMVERGAMPTSV